MSAREQVHRVLRRQPPDRIVYTPNYWQWFTHQQNHGLLASELCSPLKILHLAAGPTESVFLLTEETDRCAEGMRLHEEAQLDLVRQMLEAGVEAMIAMEMSEEALPGFQLDVQQIGRVNDFRDLPEGDGACSSDSSQATP